jgi:hypothetical protein
MEVREGWRECSGWGEFTTEDTQDTESSGRPRPTAASSRSEARVFFVWRNAGPKGTTLCVGYGLGAESGG